jgi:CcmD family protein
VGANGTVLAVALVTWGALFFYLLRMERRIKELERP